MGILEQILEEIKPCELDEQVKKICDQITDEEREENYSGPDGPNVFLSLKAFKTIKKEFTFLCLEREEVGKFIITKYIRMLPGPLKRVQAWEVKEDKANKILKVYAKRLKYIRGE